ncbi:MAG: hypothetical protein IID44_26065 [Planctomycetes bacterium]|nr:hypothetical protein [Planctomycetota bacterium]
MSSDPHNDEPAPDITSPALETPYCVKCVANLKHQHPWDTFRKLLWVILLLILGFICFNLEPQGVETKVAASVAEIEKAGGILTYDPGDDDDPVTVILRGGDVTDDAMEHLGWLDLRELDLSHSSVTDTGLNYLKGMKNLRRLDLRFTKVTNTGVKELQKALPMCEIIR